VWTYTGDITVVNATITDNTAGSIGGGVQTFASVFSTNDSLSIYNSILADNSAPTNPDFTAPDPTGADLVVIHSLIGDNTGTSLVATVGSTPDANGNFIGSGANPIDPLLGPLQDNGGPTFTHALLDGSLALDSGENALAVDPANGNAALTTDQRGASFPRILGGTVDMGAYESEPFNADPTATDDEFDTTELAPLTGNLITGDNGNGPDSDGDMDDLTVSEVNGSATNVDTEITLASGALLTVNSDGSFTYDPNGVFDGLTEGATDTDSFEYTLSDGNGGMDTATVTITIHGLDERGNVTAKFKPSKDPVTLSADNPILIADLDIEFDGSGITITGLNGTTINGLAMLHIAGADEIRGSLGSGDDTVSVTGDADKFRLDLKGGDNAIAFEDFSSLRQTIVTSKLGGLDFDATGSEFFKLLIQAGNFDDSLAFLNVEVLKPTVIRLLGGLHDITIDDSTFMKNVSILSTGDNATLAIEAGLANTFETEFLGNFKFSTGGDATIDVSPLMTSDATTFHKAFSIQAQDPDGVLTDANAVYLGAKKLKNVVDA
jgi:hypothetical protein